MKNNQRKDHLSTPHKSKSNSSFNNYAQFSNGFDSENRNKSYYNVKSPNTSNDDKYIPNLQLRSNLMNFVVEEVHELIPKDIEVSKRKISTLISIANQMSLW